MLIHNLKVIVLAVLAIGATGAGYLMHPRAMKDEPKTLPVEPRPQPTAKAGQPSPAAAAPAPGRMFVVGRVLDPAGKPGGGVPVDIIGRRRDVRAGTDERIDQHVLLGGGATDAGGRFHLEAARTSSDRFFEVYALTAAPGFGWVELNLDAGQPTADIHLKPE